MRAGDDGIPSISTVRPGGDQAGCIRRCAESGLSGPSRNTLTRKFQVLRANILGLEMAPEPSRLNSGLFSLMKVRLPGDPQPELGMPGNRFGAVSSDVLVLAGASRPYNGLFVMIIIPTSP